MQSPHLHTTRFTGEEQKKRFPAKPIPGPTHQIENYGSVLRQLLAASKEAETLIACCFELHFITAVPLEQIWNRLSEAIEAAQLALQAQNHFGPSACPSCRE